jgi:hypothetical protein
MKPITVLHTQFQTFVTMVITSVTQLQIELKGQGSQSHTCFTTVSTVVMRELTQLQTVVTIC